MARAKPKKWAAESLVSETERKATASPKQQKMAGELTAEMLLMLSPVPGGKKAVKLAKKLFKGKGKGKAGKETADFLEAARIKQKSDDDVLRAYNKAHPGARPAGQDSWRPGFGRHPKGMESEASMLKRKYGAKVRKKLTDLGYKSKGGSVKKYARGGGVRKARF